MHCVNNVLWIAKENEVFRQRDFGDRQFGLGLLFNRVKALFGGIKNNKKKKREKN